MSDDERRRQFETVEHLRDQDVSYGCEHWTVGDHHACGQRAVAVARCHDEEEGWTGALCAAHLAAYVDDPEITVVSTEALQ
jgi:hypothetical protein